MDDRPEPRKGRGGGRGGRQPGRGSGGAPSGGRKAGGKGRGAGASGGGGSKAPSGGLGPAQAPILVPRKLTSGLPELAASAANEEIPLKQRISALSQLAKTLQTPAGKHRAGEQVGDIAPHVVKLLWSENTELSTSAASLLKDIVGGAADTESSAERKGGKQGAEKKGASSALQQQKASEHISKILDNLLETLKHGISPQTASQLTPHQLTTALRAVREVVQHLPAVLLWRKAGNIVLAARAVLDNQTCPSEAVAPALQLIVSALAASHVQPGAGGEALIQSLLRWARRPDLLPPCRPLLARAVHSLTAGWEPRCDALRQLQDTLLEELAKACIDANGRASRVLGLAACAAPVLLRGMAGDKSLSVEYVVNVLQSMSSAAKQTWMPAAGVKELCGHVNRSVMTLLKTTDVLVGKEMEKGKLHMLHRTDDGVEDKSSSSASSSPSRVMVELNVATEDQVLASALAVLGISQLPCQKVTVKITPLLSVDEKNKGPGAPDTLFPAATSSKDSISGPSEPTHTASGLRQSDQWALLHAGVEFTRAGLERPVETEGQLDAAAALISSLLTWLMQLPQGAATVYPESFVSQLDALANIHTGVLGSLRSTSDPTVLQPVARLYVHLLTKIPPLLDSILKEIAYALSSSVIMFDLNVLHAAIKAGVPDAQRGTVWNDVAAFLPILLSSESNTNEGFEKMAQKALAVAQAAADQLGGAAVAEQVLNLVSGELIAVPDKKLRAAALEWAAQWIGSIDSAPSENNNCIFNILKMASEMARTADVALQEAALALATAAVSHADGAAWLTTTPGGKECLDSLCYAALHALYSDSQSVVAQGRRVLHACALPAVLGELGCGWQHLEDSSRNMKVPDALALHAALQPQSRGFTPAQIAQVLDYIGGTAAVTVLLGSRHEKKDAEDYGGAWLSQLAKDLAPLVEASDAYCTPEKCDALPALWWFVLNEAAKHCAASKLSTHWGGPKETFLALENALHRVAAYSKSDTPAAMPPSVHHQGTCLLYFLFALEQSVENAITGSFTREDASRNAALYCSGNAGACREWFRRLRGAAIAAAAACGMHHLVVYYGNLQLESLRKRAAKLIPQVGTSSISQPGVRKSPVKIEAAKKVVDLSQPPRRMILSRPKDSISGTDSVSSDVQNPATALLAGTQSAVAASVGMGSHAVGLSASARQSPRHAIIKSMQEVASQLTHAMKILRDPQGISSAAAVCKAVVGKENEADSGSSSSWNWLNIVQLQAAGMHEQALAELHILMDSAENSDDTQKLATLQAESYAAVNDWEGLRSWVQTQAAADHAFKASPGEGYFYKALASWHSEDVPEAASSTQPLPILEAFGPAGIALKSLQDASKAPESSHRLLQAGMNDICRDLQLANAVATDGLCSLRLSSPDVLSGLASLACLQLTSQPGNASDLLLRVPLPSSQAQFSAWSPAPSPPREPASCGSGSDLGALMVRGAGRLQAEATTRLDLMLAASVASCGNMEFAGRLLADAETSLPGISNSTPTAVLGELRLQQLNILGPRSTETDAHASASQVLQALLAKRNEGLSSHLQGEEAAVRVQLTAALHTASSFPEFAGTASCDARLWWMYAEHMHTSTRDARKTSGTSGGPLLPEHARGYAAALTGCCRALAVGSTAGCDATSTLPVTLILCRLLAQHGEFLDISTLDADLDAIPPKTWLPVLPQLLSQLVTSSSDWVRNKVEAILQRTAAVHLAPVLWAAAAELQQGEGVQNAFVSDSKHTATLQSFVDTCRQGNPQLVNDILTFSSAVAEVALLEDERWHALYEEAHAVLKRRLGVAYPQIKALWSGLGTAGASTVDAAVADEYAAALAPVVAALKSHLAASLDGDNLVASAPKSPHTLNFLENVKLHEGLQWVINQLERPLEVARDAPPGELEAALQRPLQSVKKASAKIGADFLAVSSLQMALDHVSPSLASLCSHSIPLPGASDPETSIVSIDPTVHVLNTKTRPKKLLFLGSDGQEYHYLVKSREDLKVDLFVSTFLKSVQAAAAATTTTAETGVQPLVVVPMGQRFGLIRWVDDVIPMYEMYVKREKRHDERALWLKELEAAAKQPTSAKLSSTDDKKKGRTAAKKAARKAGKGNKKSNTSKSKDEEVVEEALAPVAVPTMRVRLSPAREFLSRLEKAGVDTSTPRATWPLETLKKVFLDLCRDSSDSHIAEELFLGASGAAHWWRRQKAYTMSTAAMSVLGWLLGLGDRHLDNMLLHSVSGGVVHVDFGVLFDKGARLAVPEIVPFRLTRSIVAGLGPAGVEGRFRGHAEAVLSVVRQNADSLTSLVASSVGDPLIAWMPNVGVKAACWSFERSTELARFLMSFGPGGGQVPQIANAAGNVSQALDAVLDSLSGFLEVYTSARDASDRVVHQNAVLRECSDVLENAGADEARLQQEIQEGQLELQRLEREISAAAAEAALWEVESREIQERHTHALAAVCDGQTLQGILALAQQWDPTVAEVPLGLVQEFGPCGMTVVQVALGIDPQHAPLSASVLLEASVADDTGIRAFIQRASSMRTAIGVLQRYSAAITLLGGSDYAQLSTFDPSTAEAAISEWRVLKAQYVCSDALCTHLQETTATLGLERVDTALNATELKDRMIEAIISQVPSPGRHEGSHVASAMGVLSSSHADAVTALMHLPPGGEVLDSLQQVVLGYATTLIAVRDAARESPAAATLIAERCSWVSSAVQAVDTVGSLAGELQLLAPGCAALLESLVEKEAVEASFAHIKAQLVGISAGSCSQEQAEMTAERAAEFLMDIAGQYPVIGSLVQCILGLHQALNATEKLQTQENMPSEASVATSITSQLFSGLHALQAGELDSSSVESLHLAAAACDLWGELNSCWGCGSGSALSILGDDASEYAAAWERMSNAMAAYIAASVQTFMLPSLHDLLLRSARDLAELSMSLAPPKDTSPPGNESTELEPPGRSDYTSTIPLPSFFDIGQADSLQGADSMGVSLEMEIEQSIEEGDSYGDAFDKNRAFFGDEIDNPEELAGLIYEFAELSGAVAAVDALRYISDAALQHALPQADRQRRNLAAHQWRYEPHLLCSLPASALNLSARSPSTVELLDVEYSPRGEVLASLRAAAEGIMAAHVGVDTWHRAAGPVHQRAIAELAVRAPHAAGNITACVEAAAAWEASSAQHAAAVAQLVDAVLTFETFREGRPIAVVDPSQRDATGSTLLAASSALDRCSSALQRVHAAQASMTGAESRVAAATAALERLQTAKVTATQGIASAQEESAKATTAFNGLALPLVKSLQKAGSSVQETLDTLKQTTESAAVLAWTHRQVQRTEHFASTQRAEEISRVSRVLETIVKLLNELPVALEELYRAVNAKSRELQYGARGEAAAREQATGVVAALRKPMNALQPLLDQFPEFQVSLNSLEESMGQLVNAAEDDLKKEFATGAFEYASSHSTTNDAAGIACPAVARSSSELLFLKNRCHGSAHLYPTTGLRDPNGSSQQRQSFASSALRHFTRKVHGTNASSDEGSVLSLEEQVEQLVKSATSVENLARMYEGWMPWV